MPEPRCANCGSRRVQPLLDSVGCEVCGAATNYDGELVHEATVKQPGRVSGAGGGGALPPTESDPGPAWVAPSEGGSDSPGKGITTTENYVEDDESEVEDDGYDEMSKDELYELAQDAEVEGRSSMTKDELIAALRG